MNKNIKLILGFILLATFILRLPSLYTSIIDIDESQYGEFAIKVINEGKPYTSSIGEKPPLMYYYYVSIFKIFGKNNYKALHLITILWVMMTIFIVYLIGKRRYNKNVGLAAALFYSVLSVAHEPKIISTNGETLMTLPLVVGIYFFTLYEINYREKKNSYNLSFLFLAGLFTGIGILFRHQAGMQIGFLGIYFLIRFIILDRTMNSIREFVKRISSLTLLTIAWFIPPLIAGYSMYLLGVFDDFIFWNFEFNFKYIKAGSKTTSFYTGLIRVSAFIIFTLPAWYYLLKGIKQYIPVLIKNIFKRELSFKDGSYLFLFMWLIFSAIPVFVGGRFYSHYFIQVFPPLFLLAGVGAYIKMEDDDLRLFPSKFAKYALIFLAVIFLLPRIDQDVTKKVLKKVSPMAAKLGVYPEQKIVGEYIKANTNPNDTIFVWGFATPIYVYADRECGSRFSWTDFISGRIPGKHPWIENPHSEEESKAYIMETAWVQFYEDMFKYKPVYFIDTSTGSYHEYGQFPISKYKKYKLPQFIDKHYIKEETTPKVSNTKMTLYRLKYKSNQCNSCHSKIK